MQCVKKLMYQGKELVDPKSTSNDFHAEFDYRA